MSSAGGPSGGTSNSLLGPPLGSSLNSTSSTTTTLRTQTKNGIQILERAFDLGSTNYFRRWSIGGLRMGYIDALCTIGSWSTGVVEIKYSMDGLTWKSFSTPVTFSANYSAALPDLTGIRFLAPFVTTAQSGIVLELAFQGQVDLRID